jgi:hypothetical protein
MESNETVFRLSSEDTCSILKTKPLSGQARQNGEFNREYGKRISNSNN